MARYWSPTAGKWKSRSDKPRVRKPGSRAAKPYFVGVDGEGVTIGGAHRYVMLQWSEDGKRRAELVDARGLRTEDCLEFLLAIPNAAKAFAYAFNYDLTKMLVDLPDELLYKLFRPEQRRRVDPADPRGPIAVQWGDYRLNLVGTRFSVRKGNRRRVIWDVFRFYQSRFTKALKSWATAPEETIRAIETMKDKRGEFALSDLASMSTYCYDECALLARLAKQLVEAHEHAGLELKNFYGAGSTAGALLSRMGIKDLRRDAGLSADAMREAVACSFFGGRFENAYVGVLAPPLYNYDICSAYPYQTRFLPCLSHGRWELTRSRGRMLSARAALVEYRLARPEDERPWGPFPFRTETGAIVFPSQSGGGWVWRDEFLAGEQYFPNVSFKRAWVFDSVCSHEPFESIPATYLERLRLGKDGAGIVLKLGLNSVYGKLAQSVGNPQFQSWIWAAMVTSGTRAQLLHAFGAHRQWDNIIAVATDGVITREELTLPAPLDTGTSRLSDGSPNPKALGAWDCKREDKSVFVARPGVFFPLVRTEEDLERIRARGIGRRELFESGDRLVEAWGRGQYEEIELGTIRRFCGAVTSTRAPCIETPSYRRDVTYGQWVERPVTASLNPLPKRAPLIERAGDYGILHLRRFPKAQSQPYRRALLSPETLELKLMQLQSQEQPEGMFAAEFEDSELSFSE